MQFCIKKRNQVEKMFGGTTLFLPVSARSEMQFLMCSAFARFSVQACINFAFTILFDLHPQWCCTQVPLSKLMSYYFRELDWTRYFLGGPLISLVKHSME